MELAADATSVLSSAGALSAAANLAGGGKAPFPASTSVSVIASSEIDGRGVPELAADVRSEIEGEVGVSKSSSSRSLISSSTSVMRE